jgi:hypothetical protein
MTDENTTLTNLRKMKETKTKLKKLRQKLYKINRRRGRFLNMKAFNQCWKYFKRKYSTGYLENCGWHFNPNLIYKQYFQIK